MTVEELLKLQRDLMYVIESRTDYKSTYSDNMTALMVEVGEAMNEDGGFKHWKLNHKVDREKLLEEHIDILFFYLQATIKADFTPEEIETAYLKKWQINIDRQLQGY